MRSQKNPPRIREMGQKVSKCFFTRQTVPAGGGEKEGRMQLALPIPWNLPGIGGQRDRCEGGPIHVFASPPPPPRGHPPPPPWNMRRIHQQGPPPPIDRESVAPLPPRRYLQTACITVTSPPPTPPSHSHFTSQLSKTSVHYINKGRGGRGGGRASRA
jgi:hypothetical protein